MYGNEDFRAFVLSTFMDNTTHLEKAMVFALITDGRASGRSACRRSTSCWSSAGCEVPLSDLDQACRNLELAGTFTSRGRLYRFATPVFPRMLSENYDVGYLFRKILQEGIW